jgi:hypothetical protein
MGLVKKPLLVTHFVIKKPDIFSFIVTVLELVPLRSVLATAVYTNIQYNDSLVAETTRTEEVFVEKKFLK